MRIQIFICYPHDGRGRQPIALKYQKGLGPYALVLEGLIV
jgi:hypothetical protein